MRGLHPTAETRHGTVRASLADIRPESRQRLAREVGATEIVTERGDEGAARIKELMMGIKERRFDLLPREVSLETLVPADALVHEHEIAGVDLLGHPHPPGRSFELVLNSSRSAAASAPVSWFSASSLWCSRSPNGLELPSIGRAFACKTGTDAPSSGEFSTLPDEGVDPCPRCHLLLPHLIEPIFEQFEALLPEHRTDHPLGCHRSRIPQRVVFEKLVQVLVFGCAYERIADASCSESTTLRRRRDEWIELGAMDALREIVLEAYDRYIGLELSEVAVDGCITKAPCGGEKAGSIARPTASGGPLPRSRRPSRSQSPGYRVRW